MSRRDELIELCKTQPEKMADLFLMLEARVTELEKRVAKNSQNSDKPPSSDRLSKGAPKKRKSSRKAGGQVGHSGKTLRFSEEPDRIIAYAAVECANCGTSLEEVEGEIARRRQEIELPEKPVEVIEHQAIEKSCPCCYHLSLGELPSRLRGNVQYGIRFRALCAYLMVYQLLPYERTGELIQTVCGYQPAGGTLKSILDHSYEALEPIEELIRTELKQSAVAHADETGIRVDSNTRWMHVFSTTWYTYFYWSQHRGQKAHREDGLLPNYQGILMHDAYKSYFVFDCEHTLCNAHLLRELQAIYEHSAQEYWSVQLTRLLRAAWSTVKSAKAAGDVNLPEHEQLRILALFDRIIASAHQRHPHAQRKQGQRGKVGQSDVRNLLDRLIRYKDAYLRFVVDFRVPFDNNLAERDIRMAKLQQKISGSFRTSHGAHAFCRIRSYISTLRKQKHDILTALSSLLDGQPFFPVPAE